MEGQQKDPHPLDALAMCDDPEQARKQEESMLQGKKNEIAGQQLMYLMNSTRNLLQVKDADG